MEKQEIPEENTELLHIKQQPLSYPLSSNAGNILAAISTVHCRRSRGVHDIYPAMHR